NLIRHGRSALQNKWMLHVRLNHESIFDFSVQNIGNSLGIRNRQFHVLHPPRKVSVVRNKSRDVIIKAAGAMLLDGNTDVPGRQFTSVFFKSASVCDRAFRESPISGEDKTRKTRQNSQYKKPLLQMKCISK